MQPRARWAAKIDQAGAAHVKGLGTLQPQQTWLLLLRLVVSRLPYVCGRWKAALGQLWGRIRLSCSLHVVIFEYPCSVRLTLLNQSHSFHALPQISKPTALFEAYAA